MEQEQEQERSRGFTAVYVAYSTLNTALDILKEGVPPVIDRTVFRGQSGGTQNQIMAAFSSLGFMDENNRPVQPLLSRLVDEHTRKQTLKKILEDKYADLIRLHAANASERSINEALEQYNVSGATLRKAAAFFSRAAQDVGIGLSPHVSKRARSNGTVTTPRKQRKQTPRRDTPLPPAEPMGDTMTVDLGPGGTVSLIVNVRILDLTEAQNEWLKKTIKQMRSGKTEAQESS